MKRMLILLGVLAAGIWAANAASAQHYGSYGHFHGGGSRTTIAIGFGGGGVWYGDHRGYYNPYRVARPVYGYYDHFYRGYPSYRAVYPVAPYPIHRGCGGYRGGGIYFGW